MEVSLVDFTGSGFPDPARHAANILVFTKSTRLEMSPGLMDEIRNWPSERVQAELEYMANTIPSSWEFVDYTFMLQGVTRAFTHQLVRTRTASFAQQTMRVLNVSEGEGRGWSYGTGPTVEENPTRFHVYNTVMRDIDGVYKWLIEDGAAIEDARGILPTNIHTNICVKMNMRTFVETVRKRASPRTQGEYRQALDLMCECVRTVHPWIDLFINRTFDRAAKELCDELTILAANGEISPSMKTDLIKLVDQMRAQS